MCTAWINGEAGVGVGIEVHLQRGTREMQNRVPMTSRVVNCNVFPHKHFSSNDRCEEDHREKNNLVLEHLQSKIEPPQMTVGVELVEGCQTYTELKNSIGLGAV